MNGMLSIFCTLRPSQIYPHEYSLEVRVANEGPKALRNFNLIVASHIGYKFRNQREIFKLSRVNTEIRILRSNQSILYHFDVQRDPGISHGEICISAAPTKGSDFKNPLEVEMFKNRELQISA